MRVRTLAFLCLLSSAASAEYLLIHPFTGSKHGDRETKKEMVLPEGPVAKGKLTRSRDLRGIVVRRTFKHPKGHRAGEIYDWYAAQLKEHGFVTLWECKGTDCGTGKGPKALFGAAPIGAEDRVLSSRLPRRELGDFYVVLRVGAAETTLFTAQTSATAEVKAEAAQEAAAAARKVTAATLWESISREGHVSIADIFYKPGEVALRPEADPAIGEIAKLLREQPGLRLFVVGHTDDVGEIGLNFTLSKRRAKWLVVQLRKQGVAADRLRPDGVGPLAPVAANRTEEGRARNRRVELVPQ